MATVYITLSWNTNRKTEPMDETRVIIKNDFHNLHRIEKLDFLKDSIWELQNIYYALLSSHNQGIDNANP